MSILDDILDALGIGGGSLQHIQAMARTVRPEDIEAMAGVFDHGSQVLNTGHGHLETAIDGVVTGWKGDAARAASTSVLNGAMTSRSSAESSSVAASNVRAYAAQVRGSKQQILAIQPVDTSFSHAVQASGGPVAAALNPGAVVTNMAAAQVKSEQHREQAAQYLSQMNDDGEQFAAQQSATFAPVSSPPGGNYDSLPATISVHSPSASGGGGSMPPVQGPPGGSGPGWTAPPPTGPGPGVPPVHQPPGNGTGNPGNNGGNPGNGGPGNGGPGTPPVNVPAPPPGDTTTTQGTQPPGSGTPAGPPVALPDPTGSGSGVSTGTVAVLGGGAAAIAAGGVAGLNRGWPGGRLAGAGGAEADGLRAGRGAFGDGVAERGPGGLADGAAERGFARGSGFGSAADEVPGRFGAGSGMGGLDSEEAALRAGRLSAATAGELAAGERGMLPPMGGSGARRGDDEELEKRPDYLVETDDVWGDGRLAAPPVLG